MMLNEGFIICDTEKKQEIIKNENSFKNYIFLSLDELKNKILGECEKNAIFALIDKYDMSFELAEEYIKYIPYVINNKYNDLKLDSLVSAKNYLIENDLFKVDNFFLYRLNQFPVTFVDIDDTPENKILFNIVKKYAKVYEYKSNLKKYEVQIYSYKNITDECVDVFNQIKKLNNEGISLNNIYIENVDDSYSFIFNRLSKHYNIPIMLPKRRNILTTDIAKSFLSLSNECDSYEEILSKLDNQSVYFNVIFNLIVDYNLEDKNPFHYKSFFKHKLSTIAYKQKKYEQMVSTDGKNKYSDNDYVFFVGLNLGRVPKTFKDEGYLNDIQLEKLGLSTSIIKNKYSKDIIIEKLINTKNIFISYKERAADEELPSNLVKELGVIPKYKNIDYGLSECEDNLRLLTALSNLNKYRINDGALDKYKLDNIEFLTYDNKYKGLSNEQIESLFKDKKLRFSYSSIKKFFACPFSYYCDKLLGLDEFESNMAARLGTFSHSVLEDSYNDDFNFKDSVIKNKEENAQNNKDRFYFKMMESVLSSLIEFNRLHEDKCELKLIKREPHFSYETNDYIYHGYIDKLLYTEKDGEIYAAIIDYKTGKDVISLDNVEDGFNLQLPTYMFLLNSYEEFKGKKINIVGIYLQKVNIIALDNSIDIEEQRNKKFRLEGYSSNNLFLLRMLDPDYSSSDYIAGMGMKMDGNFKQFAKIISQKESDELITLVGKLADNASFRIHAAKFDISPIRIEGKNKSCAFCKHKDICNVKYEDFIELEKKPFKKVEKDGE